MRSEHWEEKKRKFFEARAQGFSFRKAAEIAGIHYQTGYTWEHDPRNRYLIEGETYRTRGQIAENGPVPYADLCAEAKEALENFSLFEERYFGVIPHPWQEDAAYKIREQLETPEKEYMVVNAPPGAGKTSLFTLRIPAWLTCRNRQIRGMIGSATRSLSKNNVSLLRREFSRVHPLQNPGEDVARGLAYDAKATLSHDYGRFKPTDRELWTAEAFTVQQIADQGPLSEKEPTWSAYGIDSEYTGLRYPFVLWDDLVSLMNQSTPEMREKIERIWMSVCENRLEPGGVLILMGQRLLADDLYSFAKSMQVPISEESDELNDPDYQPPMKDKYTQLIYKAHYEHLCQPGTHKRGAKAWPEGCLLVPERLTYRDILIAEAKPDYRTVYQQEDTNPEDVLVRREWIFGDSDHTGCLDRDRDMWEVPARTEHADFLSIVTADPSPTNFWAVEYWLYDPVTEYRYLIALHRKKMGAPDFLDYLVSEGSYVGLLQEWWEMSTAMGHPFTHLIFEANAAQKFFLQSDMFRKWRDLRGVEIIAHTTGRNKADPDLGVWSLQPHYRFGRVRLPFREGSVGRARTSDLVSELTTYSRTSTGKTDDAVMAHWFFEWNLQNIYLPQRRFRRQSRPSWLTKQRQAGGRRVGLGHSLSLPAGG